MSTSGLGRRPRPALVIVAAIVVAMLVLTGCTRSAFRPASTPKPRASQAETNKQFKAAYSRWAALGDNDPNGSEYSALLTEYSTLRDKYTAALEADDVPSVNSLSSSLLDNNARQMTVIERGIAYEKNERSSAIEGMKKKARPIGEAGKKIIATKIALLARHSSDLMLKRHDLDSETLELERKLWEMTLPEGAQRPPSDEEYDELWDRLAAVGEELEGIKDEWTKVEDEIESLYSQYGTP